MISIVLLGSGNLAHHLCQAFSKSAKVKVVQVYGRNKRALKKFEKFADTTLDLTLLKPATIYILAVNDDAIKPLSMALMEKQGLVVHTAGGIHMDVLQHEHRGVFYPLQTFTADKEVDFSAVPISIEAHKKEDKMLLQDLASSISSEVYDVPSSKRMKLHVAAVFVNNFVNHLYAIGEGICQQEKIPFEILQPLIRETADKIRSLSPEKAQTGPARRNDADTMKQHLSYLENSTHKQIYQLLSESIIKNYEEKL
ncbi:MAG: DUF2520 domain-containing protein [Croceitalea sp.]|nr:DUF2520 domain-containing protein [Croceitalea sp.]MBT8237180.1 DUF2520 domain-containing protein [Croceitalea sp.]NNL08875.1 DUF2520 domain-containing protein [Croceitalea sp.]NNM19006.1 DUF2520 domain-containing protein [Croceitalea sp.]